MKGRIIVGGVVSWPNTKRRVGLFILPGFSPSPDNFRFKGCSDDNAMEDAVENIVNGRVLPFDVGYLPDHDRYFILMTAIGEETGMDFKPKDDDERSLMNADAFLDKEASPEELLKKITEILG